MKFHNTGAVTRFWYKLLPNLLVKPAIKINLLYLLSLPFFWLHILALFHFGSVGTIGPCSPSSVCVCFGWWCVALFYVLILGSVLLCFTIKPILGNGYSPGVIP